MNQPEHLNGGAPAAGVPINVSVCRALSDMLARAERGEIHSLVAVGVNNQGYLTSDVLVIDNVTTAILALGALGVARAKLEAALVGIQQQQPGGRIIRPTNAAAPPIG